MKTIEVINPTPEQLKYTHGTLDESSLREIREGIEELEQSGVSVVSASGSRAAVPNSYRSAYKMTAPYWGYSDGILRPRNGRLENRPRGASIPAHYLIRATDTPQGFRCFRRNDDGTMLVRRS